MNHLTSQREDPRTATDTQEQQWSDREFCHCDDRWAPTYSQADTICEHPAEGVRSEDPDRVGIM